VHACLFVRGRSCWCGCGCVSPKKRLPAFERSASIYYYYWTLPVEVLGVSVHELPESAATRGLASRGAQGERKPLLSGHASSSRAGARTPGGAARSPTDCRAQSLAGDTRARPPQHTLEHMCGRAYTEHNPHHWYRRKAQASAGAVCSCLEGGARSEMDPCPQLRKTMSQSGHAAQYRRRGMVGFTSTHEPAPSVRAGEAWKQEGEAQRRRRQNELQQLWPGHGRHAGVVRAPSLALAPSRPPLPHARSQELGRRLARRALALALAGIAAVPH
jgi:hypothetical protein